MRAFFKTQKRDVSLEHGVFRCPETGVMGALFVQAEPHRPVDEIHTWVWNNPGFKVTAIHAR